MTFGCFVQLKYHDTGREKDCLPQVGQWNMMNKVLYEFKLLFIYLVLERRSYIAFHDCMVGNGRHFVFQSLVYFTVV